MMDKIMNWAIFGALSVVWVVGMVWVMQTYKMDDHVAYMFVTIFTLILIVGKTEGSNGLEHAINAFKSCVNGIVGWAVASIVFMVVYMFTLGDGFNMPELIEDLVLTEIAYLSTLIMGGSFNAVRD